MGARVEVSVLKRTVVIVVLLLLATSAAALEKPKLVLVIVVDQFRYDYLLRFQNDTKEGLAYLLQNGASFANAQYEQMPTVTSVGHSIVLSGAPPSISGIVGNEWYDRSSGKQVTSVSDESTRLLGGPGGAGFSPHRLLVSTVGDELKTANQGRSHVFGVSLKERSAILPAGHMADGAFWFDAQSGNFASSTFYYPDLPQWVKDFNAARPADRFKGVRWFTAVLPAEAGPNLYSALAATPFGNELVESFAERTIRSGQLGRHESPDLLTVSFSSNDYVGHEFGPEAPQVRDISIRTDHVLGRLFQFVDAQVGMQNVLVVLTADHGVAPVPELNASRKMPGGRIAAGEVTGAVQKALSHAYGDGSWIAGTGEASIYLNYPLIRDKKLEIGAVQRTAARAAALPHVFRVYTGEELQRGWLQADVIGTRLMNGFNWRNGADLYVLLDPYWIDTTLGTTHGSGFTYDTHVPIVFAGAGIRAGVFYQSAAPNDIAPTVATILGVQIPSGSTGRILSEIF
jgi:hypothetical protein